MTKLEDWITCCHSLKVLKRAGIDSIEQLSLLSYEELLKIRGIGPVIAGDLQKRIEEWKKKKDYIHGLRPLIGHRKIILNAATTIIERDGKILLQRRTDNGKWGLIGGLLEMNETYQEAALREAREETGLEIRLESFLGIYHNHDMVWGNGDCAHVVTAFFTAAVISGEPRVDEESFELRFFGLEEIPDLFAEDHIAAMEAYISGVRYPLLRENAYHPSATKFV